MTRFAAVFLVLTVLLTVAGQLMVKRGMLQVGASPDHVGLLPSFILRAITNPWVLLGLACAAGAATSWLVAISRTALSVAYPFMALTIVLVLAMSGVLFDEPVPLSRWVGAAVVGLGLIVASRS